MTTRPNNSKMNKYIYLNYLLGFLFFIGLHQQSKAQSKDTVKISPIPHLLVWHNTLAGPKTDMFRDPNVTYNTDNAPKLLFKPDNNFILSTSIQHSFLNKWDGGAIVLIEDSLNWIKFCFEKDYTGAKRVVSVVTKEISDDCNSVEIKSNRVFYKIAKAENVITLYYSVDNKKWFLVRHLQFNNTKNIKIGFLAQSPTGNKCEVKFSNISYLAKKIKDPYLGE
jgi:uncharacterized protein